MTEHYERYCLADADFYDVLTGPRSEGLAFPVARRELPEGWTRRENDDWLSFDPPNTALPTQGWKVHVSACLDNADRVLEANWDYCTPREIPFKFLRGRHVLHARNAKYADRGSSGKLVTVYPRDEQQLEAVLAELGELLRGEPGPYILSDLRWREGPLYVRYGAFARRFCVSSRGEPVPAIENPEGELVPDRREAVFRPPEWVTLPTFLSSEQQARNRATVADLPYRIEKVLHFSNGGGLYVAEDTRDGQRVVLKEARPHAGLAADGADAVSRLRGERENLERLSGIEGIPRLHDHFALDGHEFLVLEHVEGVSLNQTYAERYPLSDPSATKRDFADYTRWALDVHRKVSDIIAEIHARDVVYGDLHMFNIMVRPDGRVALVDFEVASGREQLRRPTLANPAFVAPPDRAGFDLDRYALACLALALFLPITTILRFDRHKARQLAETISEHFTVPRSFLEQALRVIEPDGDQQPTGGEPAANGRAGNGRAGSDPAGGGEPAPLTPHRDGWQQARASLTAGILASATPEREDRLFPGDVSQFSTGGLNLAYGAAGVLYALAVTDSGRYPSFEEWLTLRALRPEPGARFGFFDGLHGVAYALDQLGHQQRALDVLDICRQQPWMSLGDGLFDGVSGIGLNLAHFASRTGDDELLAEATSAAEKIASGLGAVEDVATTSGGKHPRAGLMHGSSGKALLFVRLYERTGDAGLLDLAATALRQDLRRCARRENGTMQVNEGSRTLPYLDKGGTGIGVVLDEFLRHRRDEEFVEASRTLRASARSPFYVQSGLFSGRAGIIAYLSRGHPPGRAADSDEGIAAHVRRLNWHALSYKGHLAFPGERLLRLSMDLATGAAGVLLALGAAMHDQPVGLPLLEPGRADDGAVPGEAAPRERGTDDGDGTGTRDTTAIREGR